MGKVRKQGPKGGESPAAKPTEAPAISPATAKATPKTTGKGGVSPKKAVGSTAPPAKPGSPVKAVKSKPPVLTTVVVAHNDSPSGTPATYKPAIIPPRVSAAALSKMKEKEALVRTPTLVQVNPDAPTKVLNLPDIASIAKAMATKQPLNTIKSLDKSSTSVKKKKKIIVKQSDKDPMKIKPKLKASSGLASKSTSSTSGTTTDVTLQKEPGTGVITVKKMKPKVKVKSKAAPTASSGQGTVKVKASTTASGEGEVAVKAKASSSSSTGAAEGGVKTASTSAASGDSAAPPQPPKKKKKFFSQQNKPEIKITNVGPAVHVQKKEKEKYTIYKLYHEMRESCVISDRWCIPEPMWDPHTNREVLLCYEVDVLMDGSVRMKRCLKILENFELIVLLDGTDKTHLFKEKHPYIRSSQELLDLIRRVTMIKVCFGIKDCDPTDFESLANKVIERGGSWFSVECNVEVEKGCLGNICKRCTSLRNTLRRKMKRQFGLDNPTPGQSSTPNRSVLSNSVKPVSRTVGEALYTNLHFMSGMNRIPHDEMELPPPSRANQVFHPELKIYMNSELKERLDDLAANPPPPLTKIEHVVEFDPRTMTKTLKRIHTPVLPSSFRNIITGGGRSAGNKRIKADQNPTYVMGSNGELTLLQTSTGETIQLPEGYVLADEGGSSWGDNVVVQKLDGQDDQFVIGEDNSIMVGSNFTLEDGEEYEVIGEASAGEGDSIQVLPLGNNSDIEIIEVDENMIQLVDENSQPEIQPVDTSSDIFKFLQAQSRLHV